MYDGVPATRPAAGGFVVAVRDRARDAEVGDERVPFLKQDVRRLDVEVDDAVAVRVVERQRDLAAEPYRFVARQSAVPLQPLAQRFAGRERRHEVDERGLLLAGETHFPGVVQRKNVRVREARRDLDLALETRAVDGSRDTGVDGLDRNLPAVAQVIGEVDGPHPAAPDLTDDAIAAS